MQRTRILVIRRTLAIFLWSWSGYVFWMVSWIISESLSSNEDELFFLSGAIGLMISGMFTLATGVLPWRR